MLKFFFTPKYFQVLRQNNSKSFYLENIKVRLRDNFSTDWFHWCVCECTKSGSVVWCCFFPEHLILNFFRLKVKVDLLKLTLNLGFPHDYFQILRQKKSKPFFSKTLKFDRETIIWSSYSNIWGKSGSVVRRCFFPEHLIFFSS